MPRRRLQLLLRCMVAAYLLSLGVVVAAQVAGEQAELLRAVLVGVLVVGGIGAFMWLRPRPFQRGGDGREELHTLRALRRGQPGGTTDQQAAAVDASRRTLFGSLPQVLLWSVIALNNLDGDRAVFWVVVAVIALVGCGVWLVAARWRMAQLDRWERARAAAAPAPGPGA